MGRMVVPRKRTLALWIVYLGLAMLSFSGFLRMGASILNWYWLNFANVLPGPWYLVVSGGLWGIAGLAGLVWLWFAFPWHRQVGTGIAILFFLSYWFDRLFVGNPQGNLPNAVFSALLTFLGMAIVFLVLRPWKK